MVNMLFRGFHKDPFGDSTIIIDGKEITGEWIISGSITHFYEEELHKIYMPKRDSYCEAKHNEDDTITALRGIEQFRIIPETLGQCTWIYDTNNKLIYEGDIVECVSLRDFFSLNGAPMEPFRRFMTVEFHNGCMRLREDYGDDVLEPNYWDIIFDGDCEIVGNKFEGKKYENRFASVQSEDM